MSDEALEARMAAALQGLQRSLKSAEDREELLAGTDNGLVWEGRACAYREAVVLITRATEPPTPGLPADVVALVAEVIEVLGPVDR